MMGGEQTDASAGRALSGGADAVLLADLNDDGTLRVEVPTGWTIAPTGQPFKLAKRGDKTRLTLVSAKTFTTGVVVLSYQTTGA